MAGPSSQPAITPSNPRITAHATAATGCSHGHATGAPTTCTHGHATGAADCSHGHADPPASASTPQLPNAKKTKGKKAADPNETGKLLAAKINQLELDAAGDKEQELEIGRLLFIHTFPESITHYGGIFFQICGKTRMPNIPPRTFQQIQLKLYASDLVVPSQDRRRQIIFIHPYILYLIFMD